MLTAHLFLIFDKPDFWGLKYPPSALKRGTFPPPAKIYFFRTNLEVLVYLGRCDQNQTYHISNEDKLEHMKATC